LAAKIKDALGVDARLIPEGRGIFDVAVDGKLLYSKFETGTFPDNDQLVDLLQSDRGEQSN
jgi:selT/selW/selH-like putative selenoprotein